MAMEALKAKACELRMGHWFGLAAWALLFLAFVFAIVGLAGPWWTASQEQGTVTTEVSYTLWGSTVEVTVSEVTTTTDSDIDDLCSQDGITDETKEMCNKIRAVRAFVFLEFFAVLVALVCASLAFASFLHERMQKTTVNVMLLAGAASAGTAAFCALIAVAVAAGVNMGDDVGLGGGGFVCTVLSLTLCCLPGLILEVVCWWHTKDTTTEIVVVEAGKASGPTMLTNGGSGAKKAQQGAAQEAVPEAAQEV